MCDEKLGPSFSAGGYELSAWEEPFNGNGKGWSITNRPGYGIPADDEGKNMLTNKDDGWF